MTTQAEQDTARSHEIVKLMSGILVGESPVVQGAALGNLISLFVASAPHDEQEGLLQDMIELVRELLPEYEQMIRETERQTPSSGEGGHA